MEELVSALPVRLNNINKPDLLNYFCNTWMLYETLFKTIKDEKSFYIKPDPLRHPLIFYLGHTAVFYVNKLNRAGLIEFSINAAYEHLFEKGVDPACEDDLAEFPTSWPTVDEVWQYRKKVYESIVGWLHHINIEKLISSDSPLWSFFMSLEHDRIHFETSSVLIRQLSTDLLLKPKNWKYAPTNYKVSAKEHRSQMVTIPAATVELGKKDHSLYGWDNEYGCLKVDVPEFQVGKDLVTNLQYQLFVEHSGYEKKENWCKDGWEWRLRTKTNKPKFWLNKNGKYYYRAMFDVIEMPLDWPVEVNYYETKAYCCWLGSRYRLMSEAEFMAIVKFSTLNDPYDDPLNYNLNLQYGSSTPVGFFSKSDSNNSAINDIYGNVWQWLSDHFYPLPGFKQHPYYSDFSIPYYDSDHVMLRGGSWASTGTSASCEYRLWFRKHFFQHAGFRVCYS